MVINDHVEQLKNKCYQGLWDNRRRGEPYNYYLIN